VHARVCRSSIGDETGSGLDLEGRADVCLRCLSFVWQFTILDRDIIDGCIILI
jgi:hypothetical protein